MDLFKRAQDRLNKGYKAEALSLLKLGAQQGCIDCQKSYANEMRYEKPQVALDFYKMAAEKGDTLSMIELGTMLATTPGFTNTELALFWFERAAMQGDPAGLMSISYYYQFGSNEWQKDLIKAYAWTRVITKRKVYAMAHAALANDLLNTMNGTLSPDEIAQAINLSDEILERLPPE